MLIKLLLWLLECEKKNNTITDYDYRNTKKYLKNKL